MNAQPTSLRSIVRVCVAVFALSLAGCGGFSRPAPVKETYLLEPTPPPAAATPRSDTLRMGVVNVAVPFRSRPFVYRESDLRFVTDFYVEFLIAPTAMFTEQTARSLSAANVFARVVSQGGATAADWQLDGFVSALYEDQRDQAKPAAELAITYYLTPEGQGITTPVWSREYRRHLPVSPATPSAYAGALNKAFSEILADLARDLATVQKPKQ